MKTIVFDIETGPLTAAELADRIPPFDPSDVKVGNIKDPDKIAAKISEAKANYLADFLDRAALDPMTGRVVAIGVKVFDSRGEFGPDFIKGGSTIIIGHDNEAETLMEFWSLLIGDCGRLAPIIGFNICQFDLPFLFRRSWKHRVMVPLGIRRGRYWGDQVVDLRDIWQLGDRQARGSLDTIARHLGVGAKNGDGKDFASLWASDRAKAEAYLRNDLDMTARVAEALGVCI